MVNDGGGCGSERERGKRCGKAVILLRKNNKIT